MKSVAYLGLGSNVKPGKNIASGIRDLERLFGAVELSPFYQCPAVGFDGADFINLAARIETTMGPVGLKNCLHQIEDSHARQRDVPRFSDRTLDIDILLYDDLWLLSPALEIPRDEILTEAHVLKPLADIAPDVMHPVRRKTIAALWAEFDSTNARLQEINL